MVDLLLFSASSGLVAIYGPAQETLVLIAHAQKPLQTACADGSNEDRSLNLVLTLQLHCTLCEHPMLWSVCAFAARRGDTYKIIIIIIIIC